MTPPTRSDLDARTLERLAEASRDIAGATDLPRACAAALAAAVELSGARGGEVVTLDEGSVMVPRATAGTPRGTQPVSVSELAGGVGRLALWGDPLPPHPAVAVLAGHLAVAVAGARSRRDATRQRSHARRLAGAARALRDVQPTEQTVLALLREAQTLAEAGASALVTGLPGDPGPVVSAGIEPDHEPALVELVCGEAAERLSHGEGFTGPVPGASPLRSDGYAGYAATPVGGSPDRIGTLVVLTRGARGVDDDLLGALVGLADQAATALGAAALRERLSDLATVDPATRFFNERYFATRLEQETHRALRNGDILSLLVVRIDQLATLRATRRGPAADSAISALAEFMVPRLRATDIGCRTSPDEFALILPSAGGLDAYLIGERIRAGFRLEAALGWNATLSLGLATFPDPAGTADQLVTFAHTACDFAARHGGDRVFMYDREVAAGLDAADHRARLAAESLLSTITSLAAAIDERHPTTREHSQNVGRIAALLAEEMGMPGAHVEHVRLAGLLHDVGKIGVTDELLVRPGPLNDREWDEIRQHPEMAYRMLSGARLEQVSEWVRCHMERPDGTGYPRGLGADDIPVEAGIVAVANALDAMTNDRPYRSARPFRDAVDEVVAASGTQFLPQVVDVLKSILERNDGELGSPDETSGEAP